VLVYAASVDPDTTYYHEAMREPDSAEFIKAMGKEVHSHTENEVWELAGAKNNRSTRNQDPPSSVGHEAQAQNSNQIGLQMESKAQH
jgi:hypothetical protein